MKIFKAEYSVIGWGNEYNQKEFILKFIEEYKLLDNFLEIKDYNYRANEKNPSYLFSSLEEAKTELPFGEVGGMRIQEFNLSEEQAIKLITGGILADVSPTQTWIYSFNEESDEMEEFKLKAFM